MKRLGGRSAAAGATRMIAAVIVFCVFPLNSVYSQAYHPENPAPLVPDGVGRLPEVLPTPDLGPGPIITPGPDLTPNSPNPTPEANPTPSQDQPPDQTADSEDAEAAQFTAELQGSRQEDLAQLPVLQKSKRVTAP